MEKEENSVYALRQTMLCYRSVSQKIVITVQLLAKVSSIEF
jgi:hypothetical protein